MKYISLKSPGIFLFYFIFFHYEFLIKLKLWDSLSLENADVKRYFKQVIFPLIILAQYVKFNFTLKMLSKALKSSL